MTVEHEPLPQPVITRPTLDDVESFRRMQAKSWLDTYPNEEAGISKKWIQDRWDAMLTPEGLADSKERVAGFLEDPTVFIYVAKVGDECIGMVNASNTNDIQRIEALYVDKSYHGTGTARALMDIVMEDLDPSKPIALEVITYNERAQRFYEKYGFTVVQGSEHFFREIMPSIKMTRTRGAK